ncbi:MAG: 4-oxalocrotonate tautomerase [Geminicoccaceae bacterium]|nr:4-oxalocrotonate tautomerase [Geminicoccaceae bacterium]
MERTPARTGIAAQDLEITIFETPPANWGIRGQTGDRLALAYRIDV